MIKFFRKIRQKLLTENKFSKYLIYAIGEIILVVIGILIALQVNNWNEQRLKDIRFEFGLKSLYTEIQSTLYIQSGIIDNLNFQIENITNLIEHPDSIKTYQIPAILSIIDETGIPEWNNTWKREFLETDFARPDRNRITNALQGLTGISSGLNQIIRENGLSNAMKQYLRSYNIPYHIYDDGIGNTYKDFIDQENELFFSDKQLSYIKKLIQDESFIADLQTIKELKKSTMNYAISANESRDSFLKHIQSYNPKIDYSLKQLEIIGTGLPNGQWAIGIKMTRTSKDDDTRWEIKQQLVDGKIKFRADIDWVLDWGRGQSTESRLVFKGGDIPVTKGYYLIRIDLMKGIYEFIPIEEINK